MLTYHQAFDISHCIHRLIAIGLYINRPIAIDRMRVYDFYLVFPAEFSRNVRFPQGLRGVKSELKSDLNPYEDVLDVKSIFNRMQPYQDSALSNLASYGIVSADKLEAKSIAFNFDIIPKALKISAQRLSDQQAKILDVLEHLSRGLDLRGHDGFLDRTSLIDTRYAR
jgi:hypothetical protein